MIKVYFPLNDGSRVILGLAGAGDFIGLVDGLGTDGRRVQALEAEGMTTASVMVVTREQVVALLKNMTPARLLEVLEDVNTKWSENFSWYVGFLGLSFRDRLLRVFEHLASRYGVRESRGILLPFELSHQDLAEMIASSRPMISHLIAELVEQGEIARQGRHYVVLRSKTVSLPVDRNMHLVSDRSSR